MLREPMFIKIFIKFSCGSLNGHINCLFSLYFSVPVWWGNIFSLFQSLLWYLLELSYGPGNNHFVDSIWTSVPMYLALLKGECTSFVVIMLIMFSKSICFLVIIFLNMVSLVSEMYSVTVVCLNFFASYFILYLYNLGMLLVHTF